MMFGVMGTLKLALVGVIIAGAGVAFIYVKSLQADRDAAYQERDLLVIENAGLAASRDAFKKQADDTRAAMNDLAAANAAAEKEVDELNEKIRKHDLAKLAKAKPVLVERRINRGTAAVFELFVEATSPGDADGTGPAMDSPAKPEAD
jgi:hypothetical protein